jgi:hypothetical protein
MKIFLLAAGRGARFLQRALDRGETVLFREYRAPLFEIDTPAVLLAARRHFAACRGAT